jgi:hypothetical protein
VILILDAVFAEVVFAETGLEVLFRVLKLGQI